MMKKLYIFLFVFVTVLIDINAQFLRPHVQEEGSGTNYYQAARPLLAPEVSSDFGPRRIPHYDWHGGVDWAYPGCENDLAVSCQTGQFWYSGGTGLRWVAVDAEGGGNTLGYLHLFNNIKTNGHVETDLALNENIRVQVVLIFFNTNDYLALGEESGTVTHMGITYNVTNTIQAGEPLGAIGGSGGNFADHLHIEELPHGSRARSNDEVTKNPLEILEYDEPVYNESELIIYSSPTNSKSNLVADFKPKYPGTKYSPFFLRPNYPNALNGGHKFNTVNDVNNIFFEIMNLTDPSQGWQWIQGKNYTSNVEYGGKLGSTAYPQRIYTRHTGFGSFTKTGIFPYAYKDGDPEPYDDFHYSDFVHRLHENNQPPNIYAFCPDDAMYRTANTSLEQNSNL